MRHPFGTWFVSNLDIVPGEEGLLVLLPDGRCVQFPTSIIPPSMHQTQRLWFTCVDDRTLRFRREPSGSEWLRYIQRTEEGEVEEWTMISDDPDHGRHEFPFRPAREKDLPAWYSEMLEKTLQKMAEAFDK